MHASPNTSDTLIIKDSGGDTARIKFSGTYTLASFNLADDGQGGVLITDPSVQSKPQPSNISLFGNYIAASFAAAGSFFGAIPITEASQTAQQPLLTQPRA